MQGDLLPLRENIGTTRSLSIRTHPEKTKALQVSSQSCFEPALCMMHTENVEITDISREIVRKRGGRDLKDSNEARPWCAEEENLRRAIFHSQVTGARTYIVHHSGCRNGSGVEVIARAKREGANTLAETLPYYLTFAEEDAPAMVTRARSDSSSRSRTSQRS